MEKSEFRVLIKHYFLRGKTAKQTKEKLDKYYGSAAPSNTTVKKWMHDFKLGRTNTSDAARTGRPPDVTTPVKINEIQNIIKNDNGIKIREIAKILQISSERVGNILHEHLNMKKIYARWVPQDLTAAQKEERVMIAEKNLQLYNENPKKFLQGYLTAADVWIRYQEPVKKELEDGAAAKKQFKACQSICGRMLLTIAWNACGIIMLHFCDEEEFIAEEHYLTLWKLLQENINLKHPLTLDDTVIFHHDHVAMYKAVEASKNTCAFKLELLPQPTYSPDLIPFEFYLYPDLKKFLYANKFSTPNEVRYKLSNYFKTLNTEYFNKGIELLPSRWSKCVKLKGNYVEE